MHSERTEPPQALSISQHPARIAYPQLASGAVEEAVQLSKHGRSTFCRLCLASRSETFPLRVPCRRVGLDMHRCRRMVDFKFRILKAGICIYQQLETPFGRASQYHQSARRVLFEESFAKHPGSSRWTRSQQPQQAQRCIGRTAI